MYFIQRVTIWDGQMVKTTQNKTQIKTKIRPVIKKNNNNKSQINIKTHVKEQVLRCLWIQQI